MRCPRCGYFNLPGVDNCAQCGRSGEEATTSPDSLPLREVYPPRASQRTHRERIWRTAEHVNRRLGLSLITPVERRFGRQFGALADHIGSLPIIICALLPGMGQLLQRRWIPALLLIAQAALMVLGIVYWSHLPVSNTLAIWLAVLMGYSCWDAAAHEFPSPNPAPHARAVHGLRLAMLSGVTLGIAGFVLFSILALSYPVVELEQSQADMGISAGDELITRSLWGDASQQLSRGDVVRIEYQLARVEALPGDQVAWNGQKVWVNGSLVPAISVPVGGEFQWSVGGAGQLVVPKGSLCISPAGAIEFAGLTENVPPVSLIGRNDITSQAIAIWQPPQHRRWLSPPERIFH